MSFVGNLSDQIRAKVAQRLEEMRRRHIEASAPRTIVPTEVEVQVPAPEGTSATPGLQEGVVTSDVQTPAAQGEATPATPTPSKSPASEQFMKELWDTSSPIAALPVSCQKQGEASAQQSPLVQSLSHKRKRSQRDSSSRKKATPEVVDVDDETDTSSGGLVHRISARKSTSAGGQTPPPQSIVPSTAGASASTSAPPSEEVMAYWQGVARSLHFPDPALASMDPSISLAFPGTSLDMTPASSSRVMAGLVRMQDWERLRPQQTWVLHQTACQLEMRANAYRHALAIRAMAGEAWQQQANANKAALEATQKNLAEASAAREARISQMAADMEKEKEAVLANLKALAADHEKLKADLVASQAEISTLRTSRQGLEYQVQKLQESALEAHSQRRRAEDEAREQGFAAGRRQGFAEGRQEASVARFQEGIAHCRTHILMSPPGQKFAEVIVQGLPPAYLHSHAFRRELTPILSDMITAMLFSICDQLQVLERAGDVDVSKVLPEVLACAPAVNPAHGENYPWYMDVLREAAVAFRGNRGSDAAGVNYPPHGEVNFPMHQVDDAACQTLRLAFEARAVQLVQREVDFQLRSRGFDPEDIQREEAVLDAETTEVVGEDLGTGVPTVLEGAQTIEGVGFAELRPEGPPPNPAEVVPGEERAAEDDQRRAEEEEEEEGHVEDVPYDAAD